MLLRGLLLLAGVLILMQTCHGWIMGDFFGEYRDVMSNCRMDGGYCIDPYRQAAAEQETEGQPAQPAGGRGGGRRGGAGGRGRAQPPPRVDFWGAIHENCLQWEYDFGCNRQAGICCYNY